MNLRPWALGLVLTLQLACGNNAPPPETVVSLPTLDSIAEAYVKLGLQIGLYDGDFVDAYYGPEEWRPQEEEKAQELPYEAFEEAIQDLQQKLASVDTDYLSPLELRRQSTLGKQLRAASTRLQMIHGEFLAFDEESAQLYDAVAPSHGAEYFEELLHSLDSILPGQGDISKRLEAYREDFVIPPDRLAAVFEAAITECRRRTLEHLDLGPDESFTVEYVTDKPWSAYNWYQGQGFSRIQVNTDLPVTIERAIHLAAHEGYPGHHAYNTLLDRELYQKRGWVEFTLYPLFSPQSLIAEGSANYGNLLVMPPEERLPFEREVLFPLAGLDPERVEEYYRVMEMTESLSHAGNEAARGLLDGKLTEGEAVRWLIRYALMSQERAQQRIQFIEKYRSYVINYNQGQDLIATYLEAQGGSLDNPDHLWSLFGDLLSTPQTPSRLRAVAEKNPPSDQSR